MTKKLEDITTFVPFGYGMVGMVKSNDPSTLDDPVIVFVHKRAVAGKYLDGEPVLKPREEKAMTKEVDALITLLNTSFNHKDDYVKVADDYNQPRGPRKRKVVNPVVNTDAQPDVIETPPKKRGGRTKKVEAEAPVVTEKPKRAYNRKKVEKPAPAEIVPAETVRKERQMADAHETPAVQPKMQPRKRVPNERAAITDLVPGVKRTVRRNVEGKARSGSTKEVAVVVKRSRKPKVAEPA